MPARAPAALHRACLLVLAAAAGGLVTGTAQADLQRAGQPTSPPQAATFQPAPGMEIRYDLLGAPSPRGGPGRLQGRFEVPHGQVEASALVDGAATAGERLRRLDTRWQAPSPLAGQQLLLGDSVAGGGWSQPVRFGGLRFGRAPVLPAVEATPLAGGAPGASAPPVALVVPAPALAAGAYDYELSAGRLRSGWGTPDDRYGEAFAAAAWRQGLGGRSSAEAQVEWTAQHSAAGVELALGLGDGGALRSLFAHSTGAQQAGQRLGVGLAQRVQGSEWSVAWDGFDPGYVALAGRTGQPAPRSRLHAGTRVSLAGRAEAGLHLLRETGQGGAAAGALQLTAALPLAARSRLTLDLSRRDGDGAGWKAGVTLQVPMEGRP